nr:metallophosphoesterase [Sphingomonas sp. ACRSK]
MGELERQARELLARGGVDMFLGGDLFHVRGRIDPTVFNPTMDTFRRICAMGVKVWCIAGNHDLTGKHSEKLGNAMQALDELDGFTAFTDSMLVTTADDQDVMMIPWIEDLDDLRQLAIASASPDRDLIIHAPLNGVIKGLPDHGLDPVEVKRWGYRRVFVGHYHSHQQPQPGVFSIGSQTHQTFSDPGTLAGFLMVEPDGSVEHRESMAPQFVNIDDVADIDPVTVAGNYVRLRFKDADADTLSAAREALKDAGALAWVDHSSKKREVTRGKSSSTANVTLEVSVASYVANHLDTGKLSKKRVAVDALDVLREARTVGAE